MGGEWLLEKNQNTINLLDYCTFLASMYEKYKDSANKDFIAFWNKSQYDMIQKIFVEYGKQLLRYKDDMSTKIPIFDELFDESFKDVDTCIPFFSLSCGRYKFEMYLDPDKTIDILHARGIENYEFKDLVLSIQENLVENFGDKFEIYLPDGSSGYC